MAPVYQRATAKLALFGFFYLQINNLRTKVAIDTPFKTKVLLRRLKRHWRRAGTDRARAEAQSAPAVTIYREDGARRTRLRRTATALTAHSDGSRATTLCPNPERFNVMERRTWRRSRERPDEVHLVGAAC